MDDICRCGCGEKTNQVNRNFISEGYKKGEYRKFLQGHNRGKKERIKNGKYWVIKYSDHPRIDKKGYVFEHILILEKALGKTLPLKSKGHHIDKNRLNNKNSNLILCEDQKYHVLLHSRMKALEECGNPNWRKCWICKEWDDPKNLNIQPNGHSPYHTFCVNKYNKLQRRSNHEKNIIGSRLG